MELNGSEFSFELVAPGTAKATSRTGEYLDAVFAANDDVTALMRAFSYAEAAVTGTLSLRRDDVARTINTIAQRERDKPE